MTACHWSALFDQLILTKGVEVSTKMNRMTDEASHIRLTLWRVPAVEISLIKRKDVWDSSGCIQLGNLNLWLPNWTNSLYIKINFITYETDITQANNISFYRFVKESYKTEKNLLSLIFDDLIKATYTGSVSEYQASKEWTRLKIAKENIWNS